MSTEPFIGEVKIFGFNFAPRGYATCQGQIMSIAQNTALFSLLGTTYGGNGQTTFGLPNLQGRAPIGQGQSTGGSSYVMGQLSGTESISLVTSQIPQHVHALGPLAAVKIKASSALADELSANGNFPATNPNYAAYSGNGATPNVYMGSSEISGTTALTGSGLPFSILNPYLAINYSIAINGLFPSRN